MGRLVPEPPLPPKIESRESAGEEDWGVAVSSNRVVTTSAAIHVIAKPPGDALIDALLDLKEQKAKEPSSFRAWAIGKLGEKIGGWLDDTL